MAHYLVTGGCGFIGSHLVDSLLSDGHMVRVLDDLSTGKRKNLNETAELIVADAVDCASVLRAVDGVDGVFHLAAVASVEKSNIDWSGTHSVNVTASVNVLQAAASAKNEIPVVYTSSAAIYGDNLDVPLRESESAAPITAYGADKYGSELHAKIGWLVHGVPSVGVRPFNVYGPRQDPSSPYSGVISIFADRISSKQPITIFGDGSQVRDFVYVADMVKVFRSAMNHAGSGYKVVNGCTGRATSLNELADLIQTICGWSVESHYTNARKGDILKSIGDSHLLQSCFGVSLDTTLDVGLRSLLKEVL